MRSTLQSAVPFVGLWLLAAGSSPALASPTDEFVAHFTATKSGFSLGQAVFRLTADDRGDCYVYRGRANPNALVKMFLGDISDESRFCIIDGDVRPQSFRHHVDGKPEKSYTLDFDWSNGQIHYRDEAGGRHDYAIQDGVQDPLSLQIAARRWLATTPASARSTGQTFALVDDDGVETYQAEVSDGGDIQIPAGRYDTLKLVRGGNHSDGLTFWLAKNADWMPVRVDKIDDGDTQYSLRMESLTRNETTGR